MRADVPIVERRPPFGASGFTQSKCLKSGGYLSSPKAERPCLGALSAAIAGAESSASADSSAAHLAEGRRLVFPRICIFRPRDPPSGVMIEWSASLLSAGVEADFWVSITPGSLIRLVSFGPRNPFIAHCAPRRIRDQRH